MPGGRPRGFGILSGFSTFGFGFGPRFLGGPFGAIGFGALGGRPIRRFMAVAGAVSGTSWISPRGVAVSSALPSSWAWSFWVCCVFDSVAFLITVNGGHDTAQSASNEPRSESGVSIESLNGVCASELCCRVEVSGVKGRV